MKLRVLSATTILALAACAPNPGPKPDPEKPKDVELAAPPAGQGWQYDVPAFDVEAGVDQQNCYFYQIPGEPGSGPVYVNKFEVNQNSGTHHMNMFRVRTIVDLDPANGQMQTSQNGRGPCFESHNWADWPLIVNSQSAGYNDWTLPDGVAHRFEPGEWIMLQSHYVNATTQKTATHAKVFVNYWTVPAAQVQHEVGTLFATKQSIRVCQHDERPKFNGTCQFQSAEPIHIIGANGHFHSRGRKFEMFSWDGETITQPPADAKFYESDRWDDPPMARSPELDRVVPTNGGLWYSCEFEWTPPANNTCQGLNAKDKSQLNTPDDALDCCYTFGGPVDWAEHCNVFAYYYPKTDNVICY